MKVACSSWWRRGVVVAAGAMLVAAGCRSSVTTSDGRPMPPRPRPAPKVPDGARVNAMVLQPGVRPTDTNGNGYPDQLTVEAYLFARPHPTPLYEPGAFVFELYAPGQIGSPNAEPMVQWRIEGETLERAKATSPLYGPGFGFRLSLLEVGGDTYPLIETNLACRFEPADGADPVASTGTYTIQIGKRRTQDEG